MATTRHLSRSRYKAGEQCPCDTCPNKRGCAINEVGCSDFLRYTSSGAVENRGADFRTPARRLLQFPETYPIRIVKTF